MDKKTLTDIDKIEILENFVNKLKSNNNDIDSEITKVVDEFFWELLSEENTQNIKDRSKD